MKKLILAAFLWMPGLAFAEDEIRFNRDVRPILSDNCFYCHGPDEKTQEADLRLDTFEGATRDLGGYAAIVPGKPDESELIFRVHDKEDIMPPESSKRILTDTQKGVLRRWIEQGAEYEPHWAFVALEGEGVPEVKQSDWPRNGIDNFILARLESEDIQPSPEASREVLIRRVYLDLIGLLPTPKQVAAFVNDTRPDAWERLVDDLLTNPHYGERWGRHWLDQARYADSNGYSVDSERKMWPYRDWVIHALNQDMPFDQFTIEQIAGDLLEKPEKSQIIATAFHRNTLINQEGGSDPEQFRVEAAVDRVNTTGAVWLGLTLGCAQCHTHKFDPIQHREYFEMFAFFNHGTDRNNSGKTVPVIEGEVFGIPREWEPPVSITDAERAKLKADWEAGALTALKERFAEETETGPVTWTQAVPLKATASKIPLSILDDQSLLIQPGIELKETFTIQTKSELKGVRSIRLRTLTHESLPKNGPGSAGNGNFVLTGFEIVADGKPVGISQAWADHEQDGYPASAIIDGNPGTGWAINKSRANPSVPMNAPHEAVFVLSEELRAGSYEIRMKHELNDNYQIGRFAIDFAAGIPDEATAADRQLLAALEAPEKDRDNTQKALIESRFVAEVPKAKLPKPQPNPYQVNLMVMADGAPRKTHLLTRGDFTRPDEELGQLHPGGLASVAPAMPAEEGRNRLDLARWLISPENPLTPRVTMNRTWMRYFGRGIVETEEDFGTQGTLPTHPQLLDWLGLQFIENGWSMKVMHRLIVTSATYRQSSNARPDLSEIDPRNLLLARQNRSRVDAEIVRDAALCASGLLTPNIGGPSVYPPQPAGVYAFTQAGKTWRTNTDENRFRRAMYIQFYRSAPYPLFTTFDSPDFSSVCTRRVRSNTPLQALNVANDPVFIEFAQALALRLAKEAPGELESQIQLGCQLCFSRPPSSEETRILTDFANQQLQAWQADPDAAKTFATAELLAEIEQPEMAATLVSLARVLFNTDNFITRE